MFLTFFTFYGRKSEIKALKSKRKDWLTRNLDKVSERGDMFIR
jgi:hypothetical protein